MAPLSTADILRDKNTTDPNSITSLSLTHKALINVSCLSAFKNLEKLDLTFNNLTSLQGLEACVNLKWLCVQQNQLHTLKGIESLTNLTVFNAGKNKLRSMDEVKVLLKLRALILNDNEITSITGLDRLTELNTLVLSRNPITKMGDSLAKVKSIVKVSLSNCQLESIDVSIKACTALEQLRLAHNDIKTLPAELAHNKKLQILDVGSNMLSRWSDLEALSSLGNLKNLNLLGNPIAEKAKLVKKINKLVPNLQIFNSKRFDEFNRVKVGQKLEHTVAGESPMKKKDRGVRSMDVDSGKRMNTEMVNKRHKVEKGGGLHEDDALNVSKEKSGKNLNAEMESADKEKLPKKRKEKHLENDLTTQETDGTKIDKRSKRKTGKTGLDVIDDKESSFMELLAYNASENMNSDDRDLRSKIVGDADSVSAKVTYPAKKKKTKNQDVTTSAFEFLAPAPEVGSGGPSAWDV